MKVKIYTDGAARGNPHGPGGYGCILHYVDSTGKLHTREFSAGYRKTTNNRMEMLAVIIGLEALKKPCQVTVFSDSKYVTDAFNQNWLENWQKNQWKTSTKKPVKNKQLWLRMLEAAKPHEITFQWIKGHAGHPENERCDQLATTAADGSNLLTDDLGD